MTLSLTIESDVCCDVGGVFIKMTTKVRWSCLSSRGLYLVAARPAITCAHHQPPLSQ